MKYSTLNGVSCTSQKFCVAVGVASTGVNGIGLGLIERWDGRRWSIQHMRNPRGARQSFLNSVSCTSATACTAVGSGPYSYVAKSGGSGQFLVYGGVRVVRWNGSAWSSQPTPEPRSAKYSALNGVSCTSRRSCIAIGSTIGGTRAEPTRVPLAERWDGTTWTRQRIPTERGFENNLSGVACTFGSSCTAVGYAIDSQGYPSTLAERWQITATKKGRHHLVGKWSLQATPSPLSYSGYGYLSLLGVSCISPTTCTAVGNDFRPSNQLPAGTTLAEQWNGLAWPITPTPAPPADTLYSGLNGVSCTASNACIAVGFITTAGVGFVTNPGETLTLTERYS
jgi:hypothetical protein